MKNVTLTLEDHVYQDARVEAAKQGKSLSKFVAGLLEKHLRLSSPTLSHRDALDAFLEGPSLYTKAEAPEKLTSRTELYDDALLHRYEHSRLHERPAGFEEAGEDH